ncbi:hypothetical protein EAG_12550, partial [Camponotus floridanus]
DGILCHAYDLPKIYKKYVPLRVIVSSVNNHLYAFASFLHDIIHNGIPKAPSHIENSFELNIIIRDLSQIITKSKRKYDVISLFTNVPMELAVGGIGKSISFVK